MSGPRPEEEMFMAAVIVDAEAGRELLAAHAALGYELLGPPPGLAAAAPTAL